MDSSEKINTILKVLGITDINSENIIDVIFDRVNNLQKISEFNTILIQEMINSDIIPPLLLKRSKLLLDLKENKHKISLLSNRYENYKNQKLDKHSLSCISSEMLELQTKIENIQEELKHL